MARTIGLVAHDEKKKALADWVTRNAAALQHHHLVATATTGRVIREMVPGITLTTVKSGPLGGDQQIGAMIAEGRLDALIFFADPLTPLPHDVDVKALLRLVLVYDIPAAFSPATADLLVKGGVID